MSQYRQTTPHRHHGQRPTLIALCLAGLLPSAWAADTPAEAIQIVGQAASTRSALDAQQVADAIVSVVHADGIGALPDSNVAEALQRVPGVSIERDQGEGRYVRVRGLGPDLNSVTINGAALPSPESSRRAVMLDVIPTPLIRSLEVQKTLTPDQDANSIGGTVEVKTLSAFDSPGRFVSLEVQGSHNDNTGQNSPKLDAAWSDRFADGRLGIATGVSWEKRKFGSDNIETGGAWQFSDGKALLEKFEQRDYRIERERLGAAFNLDYKPEAGSRYYLRTLFTRFDDTEERQSTTTTFSKPQAVDAIGTAKISRALKTREEIQEVRSLSLGTEQKLADWKLQLAGGLSRSSEKEPEYLSGVEFAGKNTFSSVGFNDASRPQLVAPASRFDPAQFALSKAKAPMTDSEDKEHNLRVDLSRKLTIGDEQLGLKFGAKLSRRDKFFDSTTWAFKSLNKAPASLGKNPLELASYLDGDVDWGLGRLGPRINVGAIRQLFAGIPHEAYLDKSASLIEDYQIKEDIDAAYLQTTYDTGAWRWLAGVRYEGTRQKLDGTGQEDGSFKPSHAENQYRHWLPALHLRNDLDDATSLRAAWTNSVVRPTFEQMRPGYLIDDAEGEAEFGNPSLKPLKSHNLDLGLERRLGKASTVSAYLFYKRISNFIYNTDLAGTGQWTGFDSAATFANGDKAKVYGLELNYNRDFKDLPAPWNGLLLGANLTLSHSEAAIQKYDATSARLQRRNIDLPSASNRTANLTLGYETASWSTRIAANYKSRYLMEIGDVLDSRRDAYVDAQTQFDLSATLRLSKHTQLVFEALNLNDEPYYVYLGDRSRNYQYEQYGRTYKLGLKFTLY
ncbi:TonB-dependent receptor [Chitinimonas naiadis]